jgi:hypothetical protein
MSGIYRDRCESEIREDFSSTLPPSGAGVIGRAPALVLSGDRVARVIPR